MTAPEHRIGVYDYASAHDLLSSTVLRLDPKYKGPWDTQALIQYLEALVLKERGRVGKFAAGLFKVLRG